VGSGGTASFPPTASPDQAASSFALAGLARAPGASYYTLLGSPFSLRLAYDDTDSWASSAATGVADALNDAGLQTATIPISGATATGQALASGSADLALLPVSFTPYMSQTLAWYTTLLGPPGKLGSQNWTGYANSQFDSTALSASRQFNPNTAATLYGQADTQLWQDMVSLPLYAEPVSTVWNRKIGGVTPDPLGDDILWYAQFWAVRQPESTSNTTPSLPSQ
jgi:ABC-type transport system substrate-binding protein